MSKQPDKYPGTEDDETVIRERVIFKVIANENLVISPLKHSEKTIGAHAQTNTSLCHKRAEGKS